MVSMSAPGYAATTSSTATYMDNWQECTQTARGVMSQRLPPNTTQGRGREGVGNSGSGRRCLVSCRTRSTYKYKDPWAGLGARPTVGN